MAKIKQKNLETKWHQLILVKFSGLIVFVFLVTLLSVNYFSFFKPKLAETKGNGLLDISYYQNVLKEQEAYLEKLENLKTKAEGIDQNEMNKLDYVLANEAYMPSILNHIDALVKQSDLELMGLGVDFDKGVIDISLSFTDGTYQKMKKFIKQIETNIRVMDIKELSFQNIGNILNLKIKTYYLNNHEN